MKFERMPTGVPGLDEVVHGGLVGGRSYLIAGTPGCGKTLLCLQFLLEGQRRGERCLFISLAEPMREVARNAANFGWDLGGIEKADFTPRSKPRSRPGEEYRVFAPSDVEEEPAWSLIYGALRDKRPQRVVIDSLTQLRFLATDEYQFRNHLLALPTDLGVSHLADNLILLRYAEYSGNVIKVVSCLKKRLGTFQPEMREYRVTYKGIAVGDKLAHLHGILTCTPTHAS